MDNGRLKKIDYMIISNNRLAKMRILYQYSRAVGFHRLRKNQRKYVFSVQLNLRNIRNIYNFYNQ